MSSSTFYNLCPDILLEIFTYFSLNELFDIFIDLIPYLSNLLKQSHIKLHIDKNTNENFWNKIFIQINPEQIISLNTSDSTINFSQFLFTRSIKFFLQSLSFQFNQFQYLIQLEQLTLELSNRIIEENIWLDYILPLPNLKKLKLYLINSKNVLKPQKNTLINFNFPQSNTIKYLELKIPMTWESILKFLKYFPNLKILRASLYQLNSNQYDYISLISNVTYLNSLQILDLRGYFNNMSSMIPYISTLMPNLKKCRLIAMNVTNDDAFRMRNGLLWKHLFDNCPYLIQVRIRLLMSIEENNNFNIRIMKELIRTFNNNPFCEKYNFQMEQPSINRGYITLTGDYDRKKV